MTDYSVSFLPGSSGRFISNILYCLLNDIELEVEYDDSNSAHGTTLYKSNVDFSRIPTHKYQAATNNIQLFRYLRFFSMDYQGVLPTHSYPVTEDLDINPYNDTFKMLIIGLTDNNLLEVNTNHIVKNIWPLLNKLKSNGFEELSEVDKAYMDDTVKSLIEYKINFLKLDKPDVVEKYATMASETQKQAVYVRFLNPQISPKYIDKTLVLQYSDIFTKTSTGYKGLDILSEWVSKKPSASLLNNYNKYVEGRQELVDSFYFLTKR